MGRIERFEELAVWQRARELSRMIYEVTRRGGLARDFGLSSQMQRAAVPVMANIAEGFDRGSRAEFHQFVVTAKGSCGELRSHLYAALDAGYLERVEFDRLLGEAEQVGNMLGGLRAALQRQRDEQRGGK